MVHERSNNNRERQSPVDIVPAESAGAGGLRFDLGLSTAFECTWNPNDCHKMQNINGYTWTLTMKDNAKSYMAASHLPGRKFKLLQLHAHWGNAADDGSEHTVDGRGFAAELHFVHMNHKYKTLSEAMTKRDGMAVIAVFLQEVPNSSVETHTYVTLERITELLEGIKSRHGAESAAAGVDLHSLLPTQRWQFATYFGSLTTPPYSECVTWTVLMQPVAITKAQLDKWREYGGRNVRPVQPIDGRTIRATFKTNRELMLN